MNRSTFQVTLVCKKNVKSKAHEVKAAEEGRDPYLRARLITCESEAHSLATWAALVRIR
jgi:hypothetical protein